MSTMTNKYKLSQWKDFLNSETTKPYFVDLWTKVNSFYEKDLLFPSQENVFRALELSNPTMVKVIIIGQDPYHNFNQANGLAFAVNNDCNLPGSLQNIFKEIELEFGTKHTDPDLISWANQGVLLLNSVLTVIKHKPLSCKDWGWEKFTLNLIKYILDNNKNIVVICFGKYSQKFVSTLDNNKNHYFLHCIHPSPLSAHCGFFKSMVFKKTNEYLQIHHQIKIKW